MSVAERIQKLAQEHRVTVDKTSRASRLAREFSRIEGIEGDETLDLIVELMRRNILPREEGYRLVGTHSRERRGIEGSDQAEPDERKSNGLGSLR